MVLAVGGLLAGCRTLPDAAALQASECPVTAPNGDSPPGEDASPLHHGNGILWTALWPDGELVFTAEGPGEIEPDGSLSIKWPWWRGVQGQLAITGQRLDGEAPALQAVIPEGYGESGFQASGLIFPTEGCWEVTGRAGEASLSFVVMISRQAVAPTGSAP